MAIVIDSIYEPEVIGNEDTQRLLEARRDAWISLKRKGMGDDSFNMKLIKSPELMMAIREYEGILMSNDHNYIPINCGSDYLEMVKDTTDWHAVAENLQNNYGVSGCEVAHICKMLHVAHVAPLEYWPDWEKSYYSFDLTDY